MRFTKMEGLGNDYVYVNGFEEEVSDPAALARRISDRHRGVGSDGLILVLPSDRADLRMEMWNADGSRAEMCGNGLRCVGFFALRNGLAARAEMTVETGAGLLPVRVLESSELRARVRVSLGKPRLERAEVPMTGGPGRAVDEPLEVAGETLRITAVSMGNPHAVVFVRDVEGFPVERFGPALEHHPAFPNRVNAEFVEVRGGEEVVQRTWERGTGETMACGTGAAAAAVAGFLTGRTGPRVTVRLRGGDLTLEWDGEGPILQEGPAVHVFHGEWPHPV